jgi:preprotein translocase subunit SecG
VFHFFVCVALVGLVLVQRGKGAEMGVAFSSGSSSGLFGSQGSSAFLVKLTTILAIIFFTTV